MATKGKLSLHAQLCGNRVTKRIKFGAEKRIYDRDTMRALCRFFERMFAGALPTSRILYWH